MSAKNGIPGFVTLSFTAAVGAVLLLATPAPAQDPATQAGGGASQLPPDPQMRSPFWNGDPYGYPRRSYDRRDPYYDDYYNEKTFAESFPLDLAALVAPARAQYIASHWNFLQTRRQIKLRVDEMRHELENSPEYRNLRRQRDEAIRALDQARRDAIAGLQDDPQYQALLELESQLADRIAQTHRSSDRDLDAVRAMAELAMDYSRQRREMEAGLLQNDTAIAGAQQRVRELGERTRTMEDEFDVSVRTDPDLLLMRQQLPLLKTEYLASGGYYDSVVRTANVATRFAYFNALAESGYYTPYYPYSGYPYYGGGGFFPGSGGGIIIGGVTTGDNSGPLRLRPTIYPTPILSTTFRSLNQVPRPFIPTGQDAPAIPTPNGQ